MSNAEEYWHNRAIQAEKAADTMGKCLGEIIPHVNTQGTLGYDVYSRWLAWKDVRAGVGPPDT